MTLPRGYAFEGEGKDVRAVPFTMPFFDDEGQAMVDPSIADRCEVLTRVAYMLDCPRKSAAVRIAAYLRVVGYDKSSLAEASRKWGIPKSTIDDAVNAMWNKLGNRKVLRGKKA